MSNSEDAGRGMTAPEDFEAIEQAVMDSRRGRWFLAEYARRVRSGETATLLTAIGKLESAVAANQDLIAERLGKALGLITAVDSKLAQTPGKPAPAPVALGEQHMKFFKADEELFEPPGETAEQKRAAPKPEAAKGARLVIRRRSEAASEDAPSAVDAPEQIDMAAPQPEPQPEAPPAPARAAQPAYAPQEQPAMGKTIAKRRIVIIRHKAGEEIDVPLQEEAKASAQHA